MVIASYLLDKVREKGYKQGYAEGYAEGYSEGFAKGYPQGLSKGRAKAYKDADKQSAAYYKRMRAALAAGEDFADPPPTFARCPR